MKTRNLYFLTAGMTLLPFLTHAGSYPGETLEANKDAPIPASDHIHLSTKQVFSEIAIYTASGHKVWQYTDMPQPDMDIDLSALADGEYILQTKGAKGIDRTPFVICR